MSSTHDSSTLGSNPTPSDARRWLSDAIESHGALSQSETPTQDTIDTLYTALLIAASAEDETTHAAWNLLNKMILTCHSLPSTLVLHHLEGNGQGLLFVPGFPQASRGELDGQIVTVKPLCLIQDVSRWQSGEHIAVFYKECLDLAQLNHPSLVPFLGVAIVPRRKGFIPTSAVFPWYCRGTLRSFLKDNISTLNHILGWIIEFTEAVVYLHNRQIPFVHSDLRADNLLMTTDGHVQLAGFAFGWRSKAITWQREKSVNLLLGRQAYRWMAPEYENTPEVQMPASDMWSWGCTVLEIFTGNDPYHHIGEGPRRGASTRRVVQDAERTVGALRGGEVPALTQPQEPEAQATMPPDLWELVARCWMADPGKRPSAAEALQRVREVQLSLSAGM